MADDIEYPYADQGRRLRWLRQAHGIKSTTAFAAWMGWNQSGVSMFETGRRELPTPKVKQLSAKIPGFDAQWLWHNEKRGLSYDLRLRIEAEEAKELGQAAQTRPQSTSRKR